MSEKTQDEINIFDKIRKEADEKRKAKLAERKKSDDFFKSVRNDEIKLTGE